MNKRLFAKQCEFGCGRYLKRNCGRYCTICGTIYSNLRKLVKYRNANANDLRDMVIQISKERMLQIQNRRNKE